MRSTWRCSPRRCRRSWGEWWIGWRPEDRAKGLSAAGFPTADHPAPASKKLPCRGFPTDFPKRFPKANVAYRGESRTSHAAPAVKTAAARFGLSPEAFESRRRRQPADRLFRKHSYYQYFDICLLTDAGTYVPLLFSRLRSAASRLARPAVSRPNGRLAAACGTPTSRGFQFAPGRVPRPRPVARRRRRAPLDPSRFPRSSCASCRPGSAAECKWRRNPMKRLDSAMEMARPAVGRGLPAAALSVVAAGRAVRTSRATRPQMSSQALEKARFGNGNGAPLRGAPGGLSPGPRAARARPAEAPGRSAGGRLRDSR